MAQERALVVSAQGLDKLRKALASVGFLNAASAASGGEARRAAAQDTWPLVVINAPLPDETGLELAMELTGTTLSAVVLLVRAELMSMVYGPATEAGVLVVGKPVIPQVLQQSVQLAAATHNRLQTLSRENEKLHRKLDEIRLVDRAKCLLIERRHLSEAGPAAYARAGGAAHSGPLRTVTVRKKNVLNDKKSGYTGLFVV